MRIESASPYGLGGSAGGSAGATRVPRAGARDEQRAESRTRDLLTPGWPYVAAAAMTALYSMIAILRYNHFSYSSYDLSIFTQVVDSYAHGHLPVSTVRGGPGFSVLGDHFSPALAVLAPGYVIFGSPVYLLVCQSLLFGVSAIPIARLAARRLGTPAAALITLAYGLSWGLAQAVVVDFHEIALAVPLVAAGLCALAERRWVAAAWWLVPLVLVKEDLGLTVAAAGLYILFRGARRLGGVLAVFGLAASAFEMGVLIPAERSNSSSASYLHTLSSGRSGLGEVGHVFAALVTPSEKLWTIFLLFGVTAFVCLRSPLVLLVVPTLLWRFESSNTVYWGHDWHYSAVLMPIVFVALIHALSGAREKPTGVAARVAAHVPAVVATIAVMGLWTGPLSQYLHTAAYSDPPDAAVARQAISLVPDGASVETDIGLMSHFAADHPTYFAGNNTASVQPDYIVTDQQAWNVTMEGQATLDYAKQIHPGVPYRIVFDQDGYTVLQRVG